MLAGSASCCRAGTAKLMVEVAEGAAAIAPVVRALDEAGIVVESLDVVEPTLDEVFVAKTGRQLEGEADASPGPETEAEPA